MKKLPFIDALRGLAIFAVLIVHANQAVDGLPRWMNAILSQGARGVQLFFIVSAFTLFLSLSSRKSSEAKPILNFFLRRFFRIAPLFYSAVLSYIVFGGFSAQLSISSVFQVMSLFTFTNALSPY